MMLTESFWQSEGEHSVRRHEASSSWHEAALGRVALQAVDKAFISSARATPMKVLVPGHRWQWAFCSNSPRVRVGVCPGCSCRSWWKDFQPCVCDLLEIVCTLLNAL